MAKPVVKRYACLSDLNNYFKKAELLSGLTDLEQAQLRRNIGIIDYAGGTLEPAPIEINYSNLYDLFIHNNLITGAKYIITDFQTIYSSNVKNSQGVNITWGLDANPSSVYQLLVTADSPNLLNKKAVILSHPEWSVEYNQTKQTFPDGAHSKGSITFLKDNNGNSAKYDFKNIKFRRTSSELENSNFSIQTSYIDLYTFSDVINGNAIDSSELQNTKYNKLSSGCYNNVFIGDTYNNTLENACINNTFIRGCHDTTLGWGSANNFFNEPVCYVSGSIYNKKIPIGNTVFSTTITKTIHKVNEATILTFLDPITYAQQIIII